MGDGDDKPKHWLNWERGIEVFKVLATVWVAGIGTFVTMEFNQRQHELARIEAIAKMLPSLSQSAPGSVAKASAAPSDTSKPAGDGKNPADDNKKSAGAAEEDPSRLARDGAMWAIFRTANNRTMLRDLASLFPEDIYRVISSIAAAGELQHDPDALTALEVASEKLANRLSDQKHSEIATRLYAQALALRQRQPGSVAPLTIVDISDSGLESPDQADHTTVMLVSLNKLAEDHLKDVRANPKVSTERWQAKQLLKRVRKLAGDSPSDEQKLQVAKADMTLSDLYREDGHLDDAISYMREALTFQEQVLGNDHKDVADSCMKLAGLLKAKNSDSTEAAQLESQAKAIGKARRG